MKRNVIYVFIVTLLVGCGGSRENDPIEVNNEQLQRALTQAVDYVVIDTVTNFEVAADNYKNTADTFCSDINEANLQSLQTRWRELNIAWYRLANFVFGPLIVNQITPEFPYIDSYRTRGTSYLSTVRAEIVSDMEGTEALSSRYFSDKRPRQVGLLALESLTFETAASEHSGDAADITAEYLDNSRKCRILAGLAEQITMRAQAFTTQWQQQYVGSDDSYRTLFLASQLDEGVEPMTLLISSVQGYLDYLQKRRVVLSVALLSNHAWQSVSASIDTVESLLDGVDKTTVSFFDLMEASGAQVGVDSVRANIEEVRTSIASRDADMLEIALGKLDGNFKREIPEGLEVELGITFSDGD
ncbi:MAG: hypothetical protein MI976_11870 [Pseudomonadales bacterium]|nr:hypothetical protein [Pseudomonadales bacterium]